MSDRRTLTCDEIRDLAPLFVTGALDPDEMDAVREHVAGCDDAHAELLELGEAATSLLETVEPTDPPADLKARLLAAAAADLESGRHPSTAAPAAAVPATPAATATPPGPTARDERGAGGGPGRRAHQAPLPVRVGPRRRRRDCRGRAGRLEHRAQQELSSAQAYRSGVEQALDLAAQPGSVTALIRADDGSSSGFGVIGADGTVKLAMRGMAATTGSQVYTAWSIAEGSAPVSMGDFSVGSDGIALATAHAPAAAPGLVMAITLEPNAGNTAPQGPVVASGVTRGPAG